MILTFDGIAVREMLEISKASTKRQPNFEQVVDPAYWRDDLPAERRKKLDASLEDGISFEATADDVDPAKIPAGIWLVGDQGVYIMANVDNDEVIAKRGEGEHVTYAAEVNPHLLPDEWYDAKRDSFGPDDGCMFLSAETMQGWADSGSVELLMNLTPEEIAIYGAKRSTPSPQ